MSAICARSLASRDPRSIGTFHQLVNIVPQHPGAEVIAPNNIGNLSSCRFLSKQHPIEWLLIQPNWPITTIWLFDLWSRRMLTRLNDVEQLTDQS